MARSRGCEMFIYPGNMLSIIPLKHAGKPILTPMPGAHVSVNRGHCPLLSRSLVALLTQV